MEPVLILTHLLNGLLMIGIPLILGRYLLRRFSLGWRLWWIGAAAFVLSQVGHIPFNIAVGLLFERGVLPTPAAENTLLFSAVFAGLSAGVWEESFRYGAFRWWAKGARTWRQALVLGAGWGGAEAMIIGALVLVNYAVMVAGQLTDLFAFLPENQAALLDQQLSAYWSLPWYMALLGAVERAFAITIQICLTVLVLQVFIRRNYSWLFLAIGWHALVDALAVYLISTTSVSVTEAVVGLTALISAALIYLLHHPEPPDPDSNSPPVPLVVKPVEESEIDLSPDRIDESKFS